MFLEQFRICSRTVSEQFQSSFRAVSEQFQSSFRWVLEQFLLEQSRGISELHQSISSVQAEYVAAIARCPHSRDPSIHPSNEDGFMEAASDPYVSALWAMC